MPRQSKGYSKTIIKLRGKWYGRLRIKLPSGKFKNYHRQGVNKTDARQMANELEEEYCETGAEYLDARTMTFSEASAIFKEKKVTDPVYLGEKKVGGYKQKKNVENFIKRLEDYWGPTLIREITLPKIEDYKVYLAKTPTEKKRPRSASDVNRLLEHLRLILNFAKKNLWIKKNPFELSQGLINSSDELIRDRAEVEGEMEKFIAACSGPEHVRRWHVKFWLICSIETSARPKEIDGITRSDIFFERGAIRLRVTTTKTQEEREVPITALLERELRKWLDTISTNKYWSGRIPDKPEARIFGGYNSNKKAFLATLEDAGLSNIQRRDLRHWGTTRLVSALAKAGISDKIGMQITGHKQEKTYRRYINKREENVRAVAVALDRLRAEQDVNCPENPGQMPGQSIRAFEGVISGQLDEKSSEVIATAEDVESNTRKYPVKYPEESGELTAENLRAFVVEKLGLLTQAAEAADPEKGSNARNGRDQMPGLGPIKYPEE